MRYQASGEEFPTYVQQCGTVLLPGAACVEALPLGTLWLLRCRVMHMRCWAGLLRPERWAVLWGPPILAHLVLPHNIP